MKFLGKWRKHREARALDPKEEEALVRDEKLYGIDDLNTVDAPGLMKALMIHRGRAIYAQLDSLRQKYSMLHPDLLTVLYYLAKHADGNVLEIGSEVRPWRRPSVCASAAGRQHS